LAHIELLTSREILEGLPSCFPVSGSTFTTDLASATGRLPRLHAKKATSKAAVPPTAPHTPAIMGVLSLFVFVDDSVTILYEAEDEVEAEAVMEMVGVTEGEGMARGMATIPIESTVTLEFIWARLSSKITKMSSADATREATAPTSSGVAIA